MQNRLRIRNAGSLSFGQVGFAINLATVVFWWVGRHPANEHLLALKKPDCVVKALTRKNFFEDRHYDYYCPAIDGE